MAFVPTAYVAAAADDVAVATCLLLNSVSAQVCCTASVPAGLLLMQRLRLLLLFVQHLTLLSCCYFSGCTFSPQNVHAARNISG